MEEGIENLQASALPDVAPDDVKSWAQRVRQYGGTNVAELTSLVTLPRISGFTLRSVSNMSRYRERDILTMLKTSFGEEVSSLRVVQFVMNGKVQLTFTDQMQAINVRATGLLCGEVKILFEETRPLLTQVRILYLDPGLPKVELADYLSKYGKIEGALYEPLTPGSGVTTGTILVSMSLSEQVPRFCKIGGWSFQAVHAGQTILCPRCKKGYHFPSKCPSWFCGRCLVPRPKHSTKGCPGPLRCRACRQPDHKVADCTNAEAVAAYKAAQADLDDNKMDKRRPSRKSSTSKSSSSESEMDDMSQDQERDARQDEQEQREAEEQERRRLAEEQERQRLAEEEEQRRLGEELEQRRLGEELEQRRLAEEQERQRLAEEQERQRLAEEQERRRLERQQLAEEQERQQLVEEQERRRLAEEQEHPKQQAEAIFQQQQAQLSQNTLVILTNDPETQRAAQELQRRQEKRTQQKQRQLRQQQQTEDMWRQQQQQYQEAVKGGVPGSPHFGMVDPNGNASVWIQKQDKKTAVEVNRNHLRRPPIGMPPQCPLWRAYKGEPIYVNPAYQGKIFLLRCGLIKLECVGSRTADVQTHQHFESEEDSSGREDESDEMKDKTSS